MDDGWIVKKTDGLMDQQINRSLHGLMSGWMEGKINDGWPLNKRRWTNDEQMVLTVALYADD